MKDLNTNSFFVMGIVALALLFSTLVEPVVMQNQAAYSQEDYEKYLMIEDNLLASSEQNCPSAAGSGSGSTSTSSTMCTQSNTIQEKNEQNQEFATTIVSNTVPVPPDIPGGRLATTEVSCPDGTVITGGGYEVDGVFEGISDGWTWLNAPTDNGWKTAITVGATEDDASLTVYAICGALVEPT